MGFPELTGLAPFPEGKERGYGESLWRLGNHQVFGARLPVEALRCWGRQEKRCAGRRGQWLKVTASGWGQWNEMGDPESKKRH